MRGLCGLILASLLAALAYSVVIVGQEPPQETTSTLLTEGNGEPEGDAFHFPPMPVDQRVYQMNDPLLSHLARKIENGSANLIERRSWWWIEQRLSPFDKPIPADWRIKAQAAIKAMERARAGKDGLLPEAASYTWAPVGSAPYLYNGKWLSGRATALWVDPADQNVILLGTADGGVWKTTNQGTTWTPIFDSAASLSIGSLAVDPNNKQVIYVGTGEGNFTLDAVGGVGIYKSTNGGSTWVPLTLPPFYYTPPQNGVRRIAVDPNNSNNVYAAIDGGLLYSTDAGTHWNPTLCNGSAGAIATDVVLDPNTTPTTIFVAFGAPWAGRTDNGLYRATNGAGPWTTIASSAYGNGFPSANIGRITLLSAPSDPKQLYALIETESDTTPPNGDSLGIFYTTNATATPVTWQAKNASNYCNGYCWYMMTGVVDPSNPARIIVGGLDNWLSTDNGATLHRMAYTFVNTHFSHCDHHHMVMPSSTTVYDANDGGFFIGTVDWTEDNDNSPKSTWVDTKNVTLPTLQFYSFAQHPTDPTKITGGLQDNGQAFYNGSSWSEVVKGDGGCSVWDQSSPNYTYQEDIHSQIRRNSNMPGNATIWSCLNFGGCACGDVTCVPDGRAGFIAPFTLDANNQNTLYAATYRLWQDVAARTSTTSGDFTPISLDLTYGGDIHSRISTIHSARNNGTSGTLYVGTSNGMASYTTTSGASWANVSSSLPGAWVTSFATDPANGQRALVTVSGYGAGHVYRSTNGGAAWTNISGTLPAVPFNTIILDPADANHAYAGTDFGVFESTNVWAAAPTWSSITYNLPAVSVQQLGYLSGGKLRAATHGRGVWEFIVSASGNPKEDSPTKDMKAAKGAATQISVTFASGCGATDNTVYTGTLATLQGGGVSWTGRYCNMGATGSCTFDPGSTSLYFVIVGNNSSGIEGSYGQGTSGERPAAGPGVPCSYTQNLTGTCP